ncbi:BatA domain-containing protein [Brevundimonas lenta]|uniref:Aerotolerance regulator N-terminal domain-containing protein n=1 Tax=Brevundimonas lenta TaxID=424796 RepID=A0A7W6JFW7_9CAUL|nr:BatA domain-containing protein [Brevundimonas lenta]MBB4084398.1 hypothetical protein [Brevundimonas lenta]
MTPGLLLPAALAALAAILVPLAIHIARRSEERPVVFAALRWLRQKPRPKSRLRFDEKLLLAARILLLALLALWLAHPVLSGAAGKAAYVAVAPGADVAQAGHVGEEAVADYGRSHWLAPGFPALKEPVPSGGAPIASLIRQLDADLPAGTPLVVVVPAVIEGADAERPRLSRRVDWRVTPGAAPAMRATPVAVPGLSIRQGDQAAGVRYLRAAALAWQPAGRAADVEIGGVDAALPPVTRKLVRLDGGTLPAGLLDWVEKGGTALAASDAVFPADADRVVVWRDALGRPLVEAAPIGTGRLMRFTRRLAPAEMPELLEADFPVHLRAVLEPAATAPARVSAADYAPATGARHFEPPPMDLRPWLAVLIGLVVLVERWLATRRRRAVSP